MEKLFKLSASSENFTRLRPQLRQLLEQSRLDEKKIEQVLLSVQEVLTNILRHRYHGKPQEIELAFTDEPDKVTITLEDSGGKFDWTLIPDPKVPREEPGGLGIYLVRKSMDKVIYDADYKKGNRVRLIKFKKDPNDHARHPEKAPP